MERAGRSDPPFVESYGWPLAWTNIYEECGSTSPSKEHGPKQSLADAEKRKGGIQGNWQTGVAMQGGVGTGQACIQRREDQVTGKAARKNCRKMAGSVHGQVQMDFGNLSFFLNCSAAVLLSSRGPENVDGRMDMPKADGMASSDRIGVCGHHCESEQRASSDEFDRVLERDESNEKWIKDAYREPPCGKFEAQRHCRESDSTCAKNGRSQNKKDSC